MNKVKHIIKAKGHRVWKVQADITVFDALKLMADKQISSVIVMDGDQVAGIFTERDYARKVGLQDVNPSAIKIADIMTRQLITVTPETSVNECMAIITDNHIRHLPVMQDGKLVGIVTIGDVVKDMIDELQFAVKQLENYITYFR